MNHTVQAFKVIGTFDKIIWGQPLMATQEDMVKTVNAIITATPKDRADNEAAVLM